MFTGIIQSQGEVKTRQNTDNNFTFSIKTNFADMSDVEIGDSIAVNGVCLTVTKFEVDVIWVDLSRETMAVTDANGWQIGKILNLEKSLALKDKLGGHLVSGHVDSLANCVKIEQSGSSTIYGFEIERQFQKYIVKKGSVAVNGVSLTVNETIKTCFYVNLIPHTLQATNLSDLKLGDKVNFEIDTIARYVEKMLIGFKGEADD